MTSLHVTCGFGPPPNQKSWLRLSKGPSIIVFAISKGFPIAAALVHLNLFLS